MELPCGRRLRALAEKQAVSKLSAKALVSALLLLATAAIAPIVRAAPHAASRDAFELGVVAGREVPLQAREAQRLGVRLVRIEFSIDASWGEIGSIIGGYAGAGVRVLPLAGFIGRIPTVQESERLGAWAAAFGPGGSFWRHHRGGAFAVEDIEFGNETSYGYQFGGCAAGCPEYASRAGEYARAFLTAQQSIAAAHGNPRVGLLAQADYGGSGDEWVGGMFRAVPSLAQHVAGWTVHTYGPRSRWQRSIDALLTQTRANGAPANIPIFITELGFATDNGPCLNENFGWSPCMTYAQAGAALSATVGGIRARYGGRIRSIFIYQLEDHIPPGLDSDREDYFGVLQSNGSPKGAYTSAVRALVATGGG
jgi:hypothetical protein